MLARRAVPRLPRPPRGFSLLELLVVVALIGVLVGTVVVTAFGVDRKSVLRADAKRLALAVELARSESLTRNEPWGIYFDESSYRFARYDETVPEWTTIEVGTFAPSDLESGATIDWSAETIEGFDAEPVENDDYPDIVIYPSGEQTPFELALVPEGEGEPWLVSSDGLARTRASQYGDEVDSAAEGGVQ